MSADGALVAFEPLPALVRRAAERLAGAETAAEVLEAREMAGVAYDAAKRAARLAKAKQAHTEIKSTALHLAADAKAIKQDLAALLAALRATSPGPRPGSEVRRRLPSDRRRVQPPATSQDVLLGRPLPDLARRSGPDRAGASFSIPLSGSASPGRAVAAALDTPEGAAAALSHRSRA